MNISPFTLIHQNQTFVSCVISITLSIPTLIVTILILMETIDYEQHTVKLIYEQGYVDAYRNVLHTRDSKIEFPKDLEMSRQFLLALQIICGMGFTASLLHSVSSAWTLYKKSDMSVKVWLITHVLVLGALLTAFILPILYRKYLGLKLKIFCAVISVDAFLTFLLLVVVFINWRSLNENEEQNSIKMDAEDPTPIDEEIESLPPPPIPPSKETTTIS